MSCCTTFALQADQAVHIPHRCDQLRRRPRSLLAEGHAASRVRAPLQHSLHRNCACCMPTASCEHCAFACCMLFDCTSECCTARTYSQPRLPTVKSLTVQKHCQLLAFSGISVLVLLTQEWLQRVVVCCNALSCVATCLCQVCSDRRGDAPDVGVRPGALPVRDVPAEGPRRTNAGQHRTAHSVQRRTTHCSRGGVRWHT